MKIRKMKEIKKHFVSVYFDFFKVVAIYFIIVKIEKLDESNNLCTQCYKYF